MGGLRSLGVGEVSGSALRALQGRLAKDASLRARFAALYNGGAPPEINESNWRSYWCAATEFTATDFRACTDQGGYSVFTARGLIVLGISALGLLGLIAWVALRQRRTGRRSDRERPIVRG